MTAVDIQPSAKEVSTSRKLRKSGSSTVVSFPPELLQALELSEGDNVRITGNWKTGKIEIEPV